MCVLKYSSSLLCQKVAVKIHLRSPFNVRFEESLSLVNNLGFPRSIYIVGQLCRPLWHSQRVAADGGRVTLCSFSRLSGPIGLLVTIGARKLCALGGGWRLEMFWRCGAGLVMAKRAGSFTAVPASRRRWLSSRAGPEMCCSPRLDGYWFRMCGSFRAERILD